ncbi:aspartic peptidase domain-containing protein [Podospora australis]|uniref:Aspartic peptidase domain-containing protein n=1 Tax=Podospora australis TaxID=1536484 RepID=A0AAN6WRN9_9PEZI|nr:aspartic peptidase domain-containing protein [Podospora australis]
MRLPCLSTAAVVCDVLLLLSASGVVAAAPEDKKEPASPLWIQPSGEWYGIDGTWSNFMFAVGSPATLVYLTPATALSEIWTISTGGCYASQSCWNARGGVFDIAASETWQSLGTWQLGMNHTGIGGNGDYGLDALAFVNTVSRLTTAIEYSLIAAINDTNYYQGYVGLGVTQGKFGSNLTTPFLTQLVTGYGLIPSHSYGYTAGAYYRENGKNSGTVASLTLGGYDKLRFVPHDTTFTLDPVARLPIVRLRGVTARVTSLDKAPTGNWTSTSKTLVNMDDSITALIDSSTPYLWLPTAICDRFATALNLTWREDLGVYIFADGAQYTRWQTDKSLSFSLTLSSYDNTDNFGQPFNVPGIVNITLPAAAFAQLLKYPFKDKIQFLESSIPYFPLKRSTKEVNNNTIIIGRAFMQEAYLITSYDKSTFSLHQALFPDNAATNYTLEAIARPPNSPYPEYSPPEPVAPAKGLSSGQIGGIVFGAFITGSVLGLLIWCIYRHRRPKRQNKSTGRVDENKSEGQHSEDEEPQSPVKKMFSLIIRGKRSRKLAVHEAHGDSAQPVEVGADQEHQVFEMPVPPEPVELDSHDVGDEETEIGVDSLQALSEYELTRRKLERQMLGPVPTYSPSETPILITSQEKSMHDASSVAHYRPPSEPSPASSPTTYANSTTLPDSLPSPMTPHGDWASRMFDLPSPMTVAHPFHLPQARSTGSSNSDPGCSSYSPVSPHSTSSPHIFAPSSVSRSDTENVSPTSLNGSIRLPPPNFQRTPIDHSRVVCLGPLPEGVEFPQQHSPISPIIPRIISGPDGQQVVVGESPAPVSPLGGPPSPPLPLPGVPGMLLGHHYRSDTNGSNETLGSNYTEEEASRIIHEHQQQTMGGGHHQRSPQASPLNQVDRNDDDDDDDDGDDDDLPQSPQSMERIEGRLELIHVPQVAEKRYSWEQDGT